MLNKKALAASVSAPPAPFVEDVFSTYLYDGTGATQSINNGIDLSGKGGLIWCKTRNVTNLHSLVDTARGASKWLGSSNTSAQDTYTDAITSFNNNGFTLGADTTGGYVNPSGYNCVSWTFRKQPKFFDVVTYTGTGSNTTISHNLGSVPGMILVKRTDTTGAWQVYHRANTANPETDYLVLNTTAATADSDTRWNDTLPTSSVFSLGTDATVNASGGTYVAYLFAHDAGGFGTAGTDNVISCGSFTTDGNGDATVTLGYEPQWILFKRSSGVEGWTITDNMRGFNLSVGKGLAPNSSTSEYDVGSSTFPFNPTSTGFRSVGAVSASSTYIYMAIRRPMKVPTTGTSVFSVNTETTTTSPQTVTTGFPVDLSINTLRNGGFISTPVMDRLRGGTTTFYNYLTTTSTAAEATGSGTGLGFDNNTGLVDNAWATNTNAIFWNFRRASGFFDVVCYTGTGSATTFNHNLTVVPELMIVKRRGTANAWAVYANNDNTDYLVLNTTAATADDNTYWNDTSPTSSVFSVGTNNAVNASASTYVAYLFATLAGVSKVGSYTGTAAAQTINCGFTGGARFVLIKRTDSTGDWYVWDTARGIVSGNDPYLLLNTTDAEVTNTDYVDPVSSGFELSSTAPAAINANGGSFIFLAIA